MSTTETWRCRVCCAYCADLGGVLTCIQSWQPRVAGVIYTASIAKWSKAPVCGTGDHGFESRCSPHHPNLFTRQTVRL